MALKNYTTGIDADKTASQIAKMLAKAGASAVLTDYEDGYVKAVSFKLKIDTNEIAFRLPCDWKPVLDALERDPHVPNYRVNQEQAVRTAWKNVHDWVDAQLALIETRMVTTQQVFLPYAVTRSGETLFETIAKNPTMLLGTKDK